MKKTEHLAKLTEDVRVLLEKASGLHEKISFNVGYSLYSDYLDYFNHQLSTLASILDLADKKRYKDSLTLIRSSYEHYLLYMLYLGGKFFFQIIERAPGESAEKAITRIETEINKLSNTQRSRYKTYIDNGIPKIRVEGPYVNGKKGKSNLVPFYHGLFEQYDSQSAFLYREPLFHYFFNWTDRKYLRHWHKRHKDLYTYYLKFESILDSLHLNRFCNKKTRSYILAHYNFLCQFTHPTKMAIETINNRTQNPYQHYSNNWKENEDLYLLCYLYSGYILCGFLEQTIKTFKEAAKKYIKYFDPTNIETEIQNFYKEYNYFWFIYNGPCEFDKFHNRKRIKGRLHARITFDPDILARLINLQIGMRNGLGEVYTPPFN